jgi:hypothetical protein
LLNENHENSKHQKPKLKQIPMIQIQNSKPTYRYSVCPTASSPADRDMQNDAMQLKKMFWTLNIEI